MSTGTTEPPSWPSGNVIHLFSIVGPDVAEDPSAGRCAAQVMLPTVTVYNSAGTRSVNTITDPYDRKLDDMRLASTHPAMHKMFISATNIVRFARTSIYILV